MADVVFGEGESVAALEEDARRKADEESRNFAVVEAYGKLYTSYEHTMRTKHQCGVCKRGFAPAEEAEFQQRLEKLRLAHPDTLREAAEELRKAKEEAERWQRIRPLHEEVTKVRAQLAAAQAELNGCAPAPRPPPHRRLPGRRLLGPLTPAPLRPRTGALSAPNDPAVLPPPRPARSLRAQHQEMTARAESLQGEFSDLNARRLELESLHGASKAVEAALLEAASLRERAAKIQAEVGGSAGGIVDEEQARAVGGRLGPAPGPGVWRARSPSHARRGSSEPLAPCPVARAAQVRPHGRRERRLHAQDADQGPRALLQGGASPRARATPAAHTGPSPSPRGRSAPPVPDPARARGPAPRPAARRRRRGGGEEAGRRAAGQAGG